MTEQTARSVAAEPTITAETSALIRRLTAIQPGEHGVLSCYIRLESRDRVRDNYLIAFKDAMKALRADPVKLALPRDEGLAVDRDLTRILRYLQHPRDLPYAPGLALFACEELDLFEGAPLARVHRTRLVLDDTPWIAELVASQGETGPILVVVIDRRHARFFQATPTGSTELPALVVISTRGGRFHSDRGDAPGWGEHDYQQRLEQEHHRHYANVVQRVEELLRNRPVRGIVLAGPADHTAALVRFFPKHSQARSWALSSSIPPRSASRSSRLRLWPRPESTTERPWHPRVAGWSSPRATAGAKGSPSRSETWWTKPLRKHSASGSAWS